MHLKEKLKDVQVQLVENAFDGWLLFDNHGSNRLARELLAIPNEIILTRRFFYWIPKEGEPTLLVHRIEEDILSFLPGKKKTYLSWRQLEEEIGFLVKGALKIAMEYAPRCSNPYISLVDGGTIEIVRGFGPEVHSSADILQAFTCRLSDEQIASHYEASKVLQSTADRVWSFLSDKLKRGQKVTEYEVHLFMLKEIASQGCETEEGPICAFGEHSAMPHYMPHAESQREMRPQDLILIDLWCKKKEANSVYADITRVATAQKPTEKQQEVFTIVKWAQEKAIDFIGKRLKEDTPLRGFEVDDACRSVINQKGYGPNFTHRTGHSIDKVVHGSGAHFDNLETKDERKVLSRMCFSVEPGIYLPGEFGVRLESNILILENGQPSVSDIAQKEFITLA